MATLSQVPDAAKVWISQRQPGSKAAQRETLIVRLLADGAWISGLDLRSRSGLDSPLFSIAMKALVHDGVVERDGKRRYRRYRRAPGWTTGPLPVDGDLRLEDRKIIEEPTSEDHGLAATIPTADAGRVDAFERMYLERRGSALRDLNQEERRYIRALRHEPVQLPVSGRALTERLMTLDALREAQPPASDGQSLRERWCRSIGVLGFTPVTLRALLGAGIEYVGDLVARTEADLCGLNLPAEAVAECKHRVVGSTLHFGTAVEWPTLRVLAELIAETERRWFSHLEQGSAPPSTPSTPSTPPLTPPPTVSASPPPTPAHGDVVGDAVGDAAGDLTIDDALKTRTTRILSERGLDIGDIARIPFDTLIHLPGVGPTTAADLRYWGRLAAGDRPVEITRATPIDRRDIAEFCRQLGCRIEERLEEVARRVGRDPAEVEAVVSGPLVRLEDLERLTGISLATLVKFFARPGHSMMRTVAAVALAVEQGDAVRALLSPTHLST